MLCYFLTLHLQPAPSFTGAGLCVSDLRTALSAPATEERIMPDTVPPAPAGDQPRSASDQAAISQPPSSHRRRRGGRSQRRGRSADAAAVLVDPLDDAASISEHSEGAEGDRGERRTQSGSRPPRAGDGHTPRSARKTPGRDRHRGKQRPPSQAIPAPRSHTRPRRQAVDPAAFRPLGLNDTLLESVGQLGFGQPTPIQERSIPLVLEGRDVVGCSQTGTGKTLAFVAPILQRAAIGNHVKALAITPTRELARQIEEVALELAEVTGHRVTAVFGGTDYDRQRRKIAQGVDFLVATPGRLLDLQRRGDVDLSHVKYLVVDEADRLLDMGFWPDVRRIVHSLPKDRQNLLFSATMSRGVLEVIRDTLRSPVHIEVGERATPVANVDQVVLPVNADQKTDLLLHYFKTHDPTRTLVFTRTKVRTDRVARALKQQGISVTAIHSDLGQGQRMDALEGFRAGAIQVLVATDIVARGIDVQDISHVVNYDVPERPEDYIHRIGRTARAGAQGTAITLLCADEGYLLKDIERLIGQELPRTDLTSFDYTQRAIPRSSELPRRPGKLVYSGGARKAMKFGLRNVKKGTGRIVKR